MKVYRERTLPLMSFYGDKGVLMNIDARGGIENVYRKIADKVMSS
jgi:adenylate kinase family enzyme